MVEKLKNAPIERDLAKKENFLKSVGWLTDLYRSGGRYENPEAEQRVNSGIEVAFTAVQEANFIASLFSETGSNWFNSIRERMDGLRPRDTVRAGETVCIDGRLQKLTRFLHRMLSTFQTPGSLLGQKENIDGDQTLLSSTELAISIKEITEKGRIALETVSIHHDFVSRKEVAEGKGPHGCGKFNKDLAAGEVKIGGKVVTVEANKLPDQGVSVDLIQDTRKGTIQALEAAGAICVKKIVDTRTQGLVFVGDVLYDFIEAKMNSSFTDNEYIPLGLDEVRGYHEKVGENPESGAVLYTTSLMEEMKKDLIHLGADYSSINLTNLNELKNNISLVVSLTGEIMRSSWAGKIATRLDKLYGEKFREKVRKEMLVHDLIEELSVEVAYNVAVLFLSGFDQDGKVPDLFQGHRERFGVVGDKGFDFWLTTSPFLLASSEDPDQVHENMDTMIGLLRKILPEAHGVDLEKEAIVVFVTMPINKDDIDTEMGRGVKKTLIDKFRRKAKVLKSSIENGKVLLIPTLVDEKTREVLEIVDDREFFQQEKKPQYQLKIS